MNFSFIKGMLTGVIATVIGVGVVLIGIVAIFLFATIGALIGAITGTILQNVPLLGGMVVKGFAQFGVENANLGEIGAALGFIAGFFKSTIEHKHDNCEC